MNGAVPIQLRVLALNCAGLRRPIEIGERELRFKKIADHLCEKSYDVVGLQEVFMPDYDTLVERVRRHYPYAHYFHTGILGSGVCVLSRFRIVSTFVHRFPLNGFPHHVHSGEWLVGKMVGVVVLEVGKARVHFYSTHLHAEYNRLKDMFHSYRLCQAYELSQFVRHTSAGADFVLLVGDMNMEPGDPGLRLILSTAGLCDAWSRLNDLGTTCDRLDKCYSCSDSSKGQRLEYILYKPGKMNAELLGCETAFHDIIEEGINYSDHCGVYAEFALGGSKTDCFESEESMPLLKNSINRIKEREQKAHGDQKIYIGFYVVVLLFLILDVHEAVESSTSFIAIFLLHVIAVIHDSFGHFGEIKGDKIVHLLKKTAIGFASIIGACLALCLIIPVSSPLFFVATFFRLIFALYSPYRIIASKLELKALKAVKLSMEMQIMQIDE